MVPTKASLQWSFGTRLWNKCPWAVSTAGAQLPHHQQQSASGHARAQTWTAGAACGPALPAAPPPGPPPAPLPPPHCCAPHPPRGPAQRASTQLPGCRDGDKSMRSQACCLHPILRVTLVSHCCWVRPTCRQQTGITAAPIRPPNEPAAELVRCTYTRPMSIAPASSGSLPLYRVQRWNTGCCGNQLPSII